MADHTLFVGLDVPDEAHEAMRDLVRMRALARRDQRRARQQLRSFLLRHCSCSPGCRAGAKRRSASQPRCALLPLVPE